MQKNKFTNVAKADYGQKKLLKKYLQKKTNSQMSQRLIYLLTSGNKMCNIISRVLIVRIEQAVDPPCVPQEQLMLGPAGVFMMFAFNTQILEYKLGNPALSGN